ncbi:putative 2-hydroxyacid dehydrogenase [bioreactor metagenome]|uniref:Putative 2-hydroxyacid dehydrogenase n=1 Tax=bioreactor metagenome TaxID=1076179 RepID=A0A644V9L3_9ZZZZ|nr:D-2-hydroxyacid dehydrogenase [Acidaminococcaceae bacterium]
MKIVVLDGYAENPGDLTWSALENLGNLMVYDRTEETKIVERINDAEIVIVNKTKIDKRVLDACPEIRYIGVLATGYNNIDIEYAKERRILVANVPTYGTFAVGQFAIALLLEVCHRIGHHDRAVHEGRWTNNLDWCFWDYPLIELSGKTMGIIGFGRIGRTTGRIGKALGMKIISYTRHPRAEDVKEAEFVDKLDDLFAQADVVVLHCPLFPETKEIINKKNIEKMKDGVIIINNSRGGLINEKDLAEALKSGKIYAAGLDVVATEPIGKGNPLLTAPNCIITPHISWAAKESRKRLLNIAVENVAAFVAGKAINIVNK